MSFCTYLLLPKVTQITRLSVNLAPFIIPASLYYKFNIYTNYNPLLESRKIAITSSIQVYLAFGLSVLAIILLHNNKYLGQVYGTLTAMLLLAGYLIKNALM